MRKDVRMGFAVGGVLLAVLIVAILVVHRNHNKAVAFDTGKAGQTADASASDVAGPSSVDSARTSDTAAPAKTDPATPAPDAKAPAPAAHGSDSRWDALFANTEATPLHSQLRQSPAPADPPNSSDASGSSTIAPQSGDSTTVTGSRNLTDVTTDRTAPNDRSADRTSTDRGSARVGTHTIQSGETFSSIARAVYGDSRYYKALENANPSIDPARLKPGTEIRIPDVSQVKSSAKTASAGGAAGGGVSTASSSAKVTSGSASSGDSRTYVVQKDDSLYRIAQKLYGSSRKMDDLYSLNRQVIGPDSTKLKPGMVLRLPAPPTVSQ